MCNMNLWITTTMILLALNCCRSVPFSKNRRKQVTLVSENLKNMLGEPINDADKVQRVKGVTRTTTMHKICSKLKQQSNRSHPKFRKNRSIKHRCGILHGRDEQYDKQSNKVAGVIQNSQTTKASLKQQREQLIREVNKLAKLAGPLPKLRLAG